MKSVFTTGEAAELCKVSQQTIIRCFDAGRLKGFRVPGSRFRRIPREALLAFMRENGLAPDALGTAGAPAGPVRVLVIDDDPGMADLFVDALARDGRFQIRAAATGYEAGLLTAEMRPDVVLLDSRLSDINGSEVCKTIKSRPELSATRIIIVSGEADQGTLDDLAAAGADDFVRKPCGAEDLLDRVAAVLRA